MLDDITMFIRLIEAGSFSKLAKLLDTTQATISRRIQNLETKLGVTIISRSNKHNLKTTQEGENLYNQFKPLAQNLESSWQDALGYFQDAMQGTIRLTLTTEGARDIILKRLPEFLEKYPKVTLHITFTTQKIHLINQNYDLAISSELHDSPSHTVKLLKTFDFKMYASPKYIEKYGKPNSIGELLTHKFIGPLSFDGKEQNSCLIQMGEQSQIIQFSSNLYMDTTSHACELAKSGEYITGAWQSIIHRELEQGELIPILPDYIFMQLPCYLIRKSNSTSKLEKKLAEFIIDVFNES